jgi:hypothetical protein
MDRYAPAQFEKCDRNERLKLILGGSRFSVEGRVRTCRGWNPRFLCTRDLSALSL